MYLFGLFAKRLRFLSHGSDFHNWSKKYSESVTGPGVASGTAGFRVNVLTSDWHHGMTTGLGNMTGRSAWPSPTTR